MAAETSSFTPFSRLPKELRLLIWKRTFHPRLIRIERQICRFIPQHAPKFLYLLGGDFPYRHFTLETPTRPHSPYYTSHFEPGQVTSPVAFSVCHESRDVALSEGYKRWTFTDQDEKVRDIMWHADLDTVSFPIESEGDNFNLFTLQFPKQLGEIHRLVVAASEWLYPWQGEGLERPWFKFKALKEIVLVLDRDCETEVARSLDWTGSQLQVNVQDLPQDLERGLEDMRLHHWPQQFGVNIDDWKVPRARLVRDETGILRGDDLQIRLRH